VSVTKEITVAELKEHLEENLADVQKGGTTLRVVDGGTAVAEIRPAEDEEWVRRGSLEVRPGKGSLRDLESATTLKLQRDVVEYLLEERGDR
jgi:antitoxin (DNA-binding transcriptional repressor) of toxin-antitoxin stability system